MAELVTSLSRQHRKDVGACQHCGAAGVPLDAAHVHGRERIALIHELLGAADPSAVVAVRLLEFEAAFKAAHTPPERALLALCRPCHLVYDSAVGKSVVVDVAEEEDDPPPTSVDRSGGILPIALDPPGSEAFRLELIHSRAAWIDVYYGDGRVERRPWRAEAFSETSDVLGNLRSRPQFRRDAWQGHAIVAVRAEVTTKDALSRPGALPPLIDLRPPTT